MQIITSSIGLVIDSIHPSTKKLRMIKDRIITSTVSISQYVFNSICPINAVTQRRHIRIIPECLVNNLGAQNFHVTCPNRVLSDNAYYIGLINEVGNRLKKQCDRRDFTWTFVIKHDTSFNAACFPGGKVFITVPLIERLDPKNSKYPFDCPEGQEETIFKENIAAVLGHEMAHACASHGASKLQFSVFLILVKNVAEAALRFFIETNSQHTTNLPQNARENQQTKEKKLLILNCFKIFFSAASLAVASRHSRHCETEADMIGMKYAYLANYGTNGMIRVQNILNAISKENRSWFSHPWFNSHPTSDERIKDCESIKTIIESLQSNLKPLTLDSMQEKLKKTRESRS